VKMHASASNPSGVSIGRDGSYIESRDKGHLMFKFDGGNMAIGGIERKVLIELRNKVTEYLEQTEVKDE